MASVSIHLKNNFIPTHRKIGDGARLSAMSIALAHLMSKLVHVNYSAQEDSLKITNPPNTIKTLVGAAVAGIFKLFKGEVNSDLERTFLQIAINNVPGAEMIAPVRGGTEDRIRFLRKHYQAELEKALFKGIGFEIIPITEKDKTPGFQINSPMIDISCYQFALMRAGVAEAFEAPLNVDALLDRLPEWGFECVDPPKNGDLVLFLNKGTLAHMGLRYKNQVLSKPGNHIPFAYVHKLEDTLEMYGDEVLYFRRSILHRSPQSGLKNYTANS